MEDAATATQLARDEVKRRLVDVCRGMQVLVKDSYGPLGEAQLLQANAQCPDALTITSTAERYFAHVSVGDCPIANAYFHMLKSKVDLRPVAPTLQVKVVLVTVLYCSILVAQIRDHADGGLFLAGLSSSLQLEIQDGRLAHIPHRIVRKGLHLALDWSLNFLDDPQCPVRVAVSWSSATSLYAVIRGIVSPKSIAGVDEVTLDSVVLPLMVQAFISVFPYVVEFPNERVPVHLLFASGQKSIAKSQVWKQTALLDLPWPSRGGTKVGKRGSLSPPLRSLRVALFNITIEPLAESETEDTNGTSIHHAGSLGKFRLEALRQVGDRLERIGATAILSQKIIPRYLQAYLAAKGIFTLDRLSATYIRGVQMLSGATVLSDWRIDDSIISSSLGFLSLITTQTIGSKQYIRLHRDDSDGQASVAETAMNNSKSHPVTTIAVAASDRYAFDELCHVITTSFKTLAHLMENPHVIAGAGCAEIHLASLLRHRARQLRVPSVLTVSKEANRDKIAARTLRQLRQTVTCFADCLENIAGQLCGSHATATDRATMIDQVRSANTESLMAMKGLVDGAISSKQQRKGELYGWNPRKRSVMVVLTYDTHDVGDPGSDDEMILEDARILDTLQAKKDALVLAVESVSSLIGVGSVVRVL